MIFDPEALRNKMLFLDRVLLVPDLVEKVVARHLPRPFELHHVSRRWEPGGGSTLFQITTPGQTYFLKVKHRSVWVESRVECEGAFLRKPSLENEYALVRTLDVPWVATIRFFDEEEEFQFLAVERLEPFERAVQTMSAPQLVAAWYRLELAVRGLFERGLVHTDIHEHNICFREEAPVLCDLEEARYLKQDLDFERSLDVVGVNRYGNVGEFPSRPGIPRGFTCLQRLEAVFRQLIRKRLPELINRCNFDDSCPFNLDELQEPDHRIYQSVDLPDLKVDGHRPRHDPRLWLFTYLLRRLSRRNAPIIHLDIGSNLGRFCFEAAALPFVRESIGLEAYANYVDLSRVLAFLYGVAKAKFFRFTCGEERLPDRLQGVTLVTMLSVYHHVKNKEALLTDLKKLEAPYLLAEFATQERYYPQRGDLSAELAYIRAMTGYAHSCLLAVSLDYQRPIVLFANQAVATLDRVLLRLASSRYFALRRIAMIAAHLLPGPC